MIIPKHKDCTKIYGPIYLRDANNLNKVLNKDCQHIRVQVGFIPTMQKVEFILKNLLT